MAISVQVSWYIQDIYLSLVFCFWIHVVWTLAGMECRWRIKKVVEWMWAEVTDSTVNEMQSPRILFLPGLTFFSLPILTLENPFLFLLTGERISGNHVAFPPHYFINILYYYHYHKLDHTCISGTNPFWSWCFNKLLDSTC